LIKKFLSLFLFVLASNLLYAQDEINFLDPEQKVQSIRFQEVNNLIVIPIDVNGKQLSFILDTGVNKTILFNLAPSDSLELKDIEKITLQGLGDGQAIEALISKNNNISIQNYKGKKEDIYVILTDKFDVSAKMGVTIHGIIGYRLLKNSIVHVNYKTKKINFYNPKYFKYPSCRKCEVFPLQFYRSKPYIDVQIQLDTMGNEKTDVKMLIDSGGSEAIWLFENSKDVIQTPKKSFRDLLGEGLSGSIFGNKSRIEEIALGKFKIKKPTVSFLDSSSTFNARQFRDRNGSIGGNILKRFKLWIDYPNSKITFKKNGSFSGGFEYNMSGIDVVYNGQVLVKEKASKTVGQFNLSEDNVDISTVSLFINYKYMFKPSYKVNKIVPGSPADLAGLKADDIILDINNVKVHNFSLKQLIGKFQERDGKRIRMRVQRGGDEIIKVDFRLKKRI